jgi:hypothetical protein
MALKSLIKYYATNTLDAMDQIQQVMVAAGWTLLDDLSADSPPSYVMKSSGENDDLYPMYLRIISNSDNFIDFYIYAYWNETTHAGTYYLSHAYARIASYDAASFYMWISATKGQFYVTTYCALYEMFYVGIIEPVEEVVGVLDTAVSSGSNVDLSLGSGQAVGFETGVSYQIFGKNYRQFVEVNAVDLSTDTLTITTLSYDFEIGDRIGTLPNKWVGFSTSSGFYGFTWKYNLNGNGNDTSVSYIYGTLIAATHIDPAERYHNKYIAYPPSFADLSASGFCGYLASDSIGLLFDNNSTLSEHTVSVNEYVESTSTGSNTSTTLNDTTKSWATNEFAGKVIITTAGTGPAQYRYVASNTGTEITVTATWDVTPDDTTDYIICDEGWMFFYNHNSATTGMIQRLA